MATIETIPEHFARKDKVVAKVDMPGIPAGTSGKVTMVSGFEWIRYWVRFDNGVVRGSINRNKLVTPGEWEEVLRRREAGLPDFEVVEVASSAGGDDAGSGGQAAVAGDGVVVNGVTIPALLLERSKNRRALLGA